jgi:GMP synthase (glutamine-hydrolysing)
MKAIILMTGHTFENLIPRRGDFDTWFKAHCQPYTQGLIDEWEVIDALTYPQYPAPESVDLLLISGSPQCVYEFQGWSVKAGEWIKAVIESNAFVLGICYGHQLIAQAMGGEVRKSKNGREMGPCLVEKVDQDPIFEGLPTVFEVWQTHSDEVAVLPANAKIIAKNAHCEIQAMAIGDRCRTVQWHPEMDLDIMRHYVRERTTMLTLEWGEGAAQALQDRLQSEISSGDEIFKRFFESFVQAQAQLKSIK